MKLEATTELIEMINRSAREWNKFKSQLPEIHHFYDVYAKDIFGLNVDFSLMEDKVLIQGATIIDDDKFVNFVLTFSDMPD